VLLKKQDFFSAVSPRQAANHRQISYLQGKGSDLPRALPFHQGAKSNNQTGSVNAASNVERKITELMIRTSDCPMEKARTFTPVGQAAISTSTAWAVGFSPGISQPAAQTTAGNTSNLLRVSRNMLLLRCKR